MQDPRCKQKKDEAVQNNRLTICSNFNRGTTGDKLFPPVYKRLLAYIYLEDGTFVNGEIMKAGYAQAMTVPPNVKYADLFVELEKEAREQKRGLWAMSPDWTEAKELKLTKDRTVNF
jgi:endonuclease YncB( thermonuclease family)